MLLYCTSFPWWWNYSFHPYTRKIKTGTHISCICSRTISSDAFRMGRRQTNKNGGTHTNVLRSRASELSAFFPFTQNFSPFGLPLSRIQIAHKYTCKISQNETHKWTDPFAIEWQRRHWKTKTTSFIVLRIVYRLCVVFFFFCCCCCCYIMLS